MRVRDDGSTARITFNSPERALQGSLHYIRQLVQIKTVTHGHFPDFAFSVRVASRRVASAVAHTLTHDGSGGTRHAARTDSETCSSSSASPRCGRCAFRRTSRATTDLRFYPRLHVPLSLRLLSSACIKARARAKRSTRHHTFGCPSCWTHQGPEIAIRNVSFNSPPSLDFT